MVQWTMVILVNMQRAHLLERATVKSRRWNRIVFFPSLEQVAGRPKVVFQWCQRQPLVQVVYGRAKKKVFWQGAEGGGRGGQSGKARRQVCRRNENGKKQKKRNAALQGSVFHPAFHIGVPFLHMPHWSSNFKRVHLFLGVFTFTS